MANMVDEQQIQRMVDAIPYAIDVWDELVRKDSRHPALSDTNGNHLTRADLDDKINRVNGYLRTKGIGREDVVLIRLSRGADPVIAAYGVWKAGAAFCLVEADYAPERVAYIAQDCNAKLQIADEDWAEVMATAPCADYASPDDHDAAACVYTSGTTGHPKGVIHEYGQIKFEMLSERLPDGTWAQDEETRWALNAPLNFVASLKILVHALYCGAHLHVLGYDVVKDPAKLSTYFLRNRINETFLSPMHLRAKKGDLGPLMRCVYVGASPANNVSLKHGKLLNCYTMSESLITVCRFDIDRPYGACPLGAPLFDLGIRLLDEDGKDVEPGQTGEICFPNPYCRGYLNLPEENAARFKDGLFHTKDMASFENGVYIMRGRGDDMVKINGNRVEPLEIEAAFFRITGVNCVCKCFSEDDGDGFATLYYVAQEGKNLDLQDVRAKMEQELPSYMVPSFFQPIDAIPVTPLGKVDRKQLKKPRVQRAEYVEPRTDLERQLCAVAAKAFNLESVGLADDVFKLGGTSLDVIQMLSDLDLPGLSADLFYRGKAIGEIARLYQEEVLGGSVLTEEEAELEERKHRYPLRDSAFILYYLTMVSPDMTDSVNMSSAFKLSRMINLKKLRDAINAYTDGSSTFKTKVVAGEDGQAYFEYAPELYRPVEIERMSEAQVEELCKTFVQPFTFGEELPWRIRLVKAAFHQYLFFDIHHVLTDGEGLTLIATDMLNTYLGKPTRPNNFFSWLYREERLYNSAYFKECEQRMRERFDSVEWAVQPHDPTEGVGLRSKEYDTDVTLEQLDAYYKRTGYSRGDLFAATVALAMRKATGKTDIAFSGAYANRVGVENIAGARVRMVTYGFDLKELPETVDEFMETVSAEVREAIATACYCYRYRTDGFDGLNPVIDDLEDLESPHPLLSRFATPLDLGKDLTDGADTNTEPSAMTIIFTYLNRDGRLYLRGKRDVHWLSDEARDAFMLSSVDIMQRLLAGDGSVLQ